MANEAGTLQEGFNIELIHWPTGPGDEVFELTEVCINGEQRLCHVLYQQRDVVKP